MQIILLKKQKLLIYSSAGKLEARYDIFYD